MPETPSRMNQSNREQVVGADLNRIGNLAGREMMNLAMRRSVRADFYNPAANAFDDLTAAGKATASTELSGLTVAPSLDGIAQVFDMSLGQGEGTLPANPSSADVSGNQLLRWPAQTVTWPSGGTPDATNAKICLIVATPADNLDDQVSRNILVDPASRATIPANVFKTSNPLATISVVVGAAASAPVAPAVPAGTLALFEVYVPALATDSTAFLAVRRAWRSIEFPGTSQHGIVKGCVPSLGVGFTAPILPTLANQPHRLVIDGELLTFACTPSAWLDVDSDTITPPVAVAGHDSPAYLYLCGGRNAPHLNYKMVSLGTTPAPVTFIASLTPPDSLGFPTAGLAIATPARTFPRSACCYIGVAFQGAGGTNIAPAIYEGDWIHAMSRPSGTTPDMFGVGFYEAAITGASGDCNIHPPATSDACDLCICISDSAGAGQAVVYGLTGAIVGNQLGFVTSPGAAVGGMLIARRPIFGSGATFGTLSYAGAASTTTIRVYATGYNMKIPRLAR